PALRARVRARGAGAWLVGAGSAAGFHDQRVDRAGGFLARSRRVRAPAVRLARPAALRELIAELVALGRDVQQVGTHLRQRFERVLAAFAELGDLRLERRELLRRGVGALARVRELLRVALLEDFELDAERVATLAHRLRVRLLFRERALEPFDLEVALVGRSWARRCGSVAACRLSGRLLFAL